MFVIPGRDRRQRRRHPARNLDVFNNFQIPVSHFRGFAAAARTGMTV
jgi:hypothetical protein